MKDLTIEQKAKAYDEAKYIMKEYLESGNAGVIAENTIKKAFPELAEDEDERIRKDIVTYLKSILSNKKYGDKFIESWISWLEKQGERKSDWSEDDTQYINDTLALLSFGCSIHSIGEVQEWLQSLSNRVQLKQEWSEEDETKRNALISLVEEIKNQPLKRLEDWDGYISWLKSLRPQSQWKPSEEQLKSLKEVIDVGHFTSYPNALEILYEQLKKLRRE